MRPLLLIAAPLAAGLMMASTAFAQPMGDPAQGIPGPEAVNPAPNATGPYVGAGPHAFYAVDARIASVSDGVQALPPGPRRRASVELRQIRAEESTQRARHGELRDWDREHLNTRLDALVQQFPALQAN